MSPERGISRSVARKPPWTCLVVDDEPLARRSLRGLLKDDPELSVVGEAGDGLRALDAIETLRPDLVFLDIQMPALDGFGVLHRLEGPLPAIVFVTAFDQYALRAFESQALDYLLKPYSERRLRAATTRAKDTLRRDRLAEVGRRLLDLSRETRTERGAAGRTGTSQAADAGGSGPANSDDRFVIKKAGRVVLLPVGDVDWIEASDYYVRLHTADGGHLLREPMKDLAARLDPDRFVRVHRSAIVRVAAVREIRRGEGGQVAVLGDGTEVPVSRARRKALQAKLGL